MKQSAIAVFVLSLAFCSVEASSRTIYITQNCGENYMADPAVVVKASTSTPNKNCSVYISPKQFDRLSVYISSFNVPCSQGSLQIFQGFDKSRPLTGKLCGYSKYSLPSYKYDGSSSGVTLEYVSNYAFASRSFTVVATNYHTGLCYSDEYQCSNLHCIDSSLHCNGYNNCGDDSDENCGSVIALGAGIIVAIVFGALFVVVAIPLFIICFVCKRLSYSKF